MSATSATTCACGHDQLDHDWWGWGPCCACGCQRFAAAGPGVAQRESEEQSPRLRKADDE